MPSLQLFDLAIFEGVIALFHFYYVIKKFVPSCTNPTTFYRITMYRLKIERMWG